MSTFSQTRKVFRKIRYVLYLEKPALLDERKTLNIKATSRSNCASPLVVVSLHVSLGPVLSSSFYSRLHTLESLSVCWFALSLSFRTLPRLLCQFLSLSASPSSGEAPLWRIIVHNIAAPRCYTLRRKNLYDLWGKGKRNFSHVV